MFPILLPIMAFLTESTEWPQIKVFDEHAFKKEKERIKELYRQADSDSWNGQIFKKGKQ